MWADFWRRIGSNTASDKGTYTSLYCVLENPTEAFDVSNEGEVGANSYFGGVAGFNPYLHDH